VQRPDAPNVLLGVTSTSNHLRKNFPKAPARDSREAEFVREITDVRGVMIPDFRMWAIFSQKFGLGK